MFVQLDVSIMQLYAIKCDYDATRCNINILGFIFNLRMFKLT
jgi:hypothetical protein